MIIGYIVTEVVNEPPKKLNRQKCACNLFLFEALMKLCGNYHRQTAFWATVYMYTARQKSRIIVYHFSLLEQ